MGSGYPHASAKLNERQGREDGVNINEQGNERKKKELGNELVDWNELEKDAREHWTTGTERENGTTGNEQRMKPR